jgi:hypothetical protein
MLKNTSLQNNTVAIGMINDINETPVGTAIEIRSHTVERSPVKIIIWILTVAQRCVHRDYSLISIITQSGKNMYRFYIFLGAVQIPRGREKDDQIKQYSSTMS